VGENTLIAYSGDVSDAQHIQYLLETLMYSLLYSLITYVRIRETQHQDDHVPNPLTLHNYLTRTMYNRRSKMDPLWNSLLIAGITPPSDAPMVTLPTSLSPQDATAPEKPFATEPSVNKLDGSLFLGYVDLYGTSFSSPHIAT
jgi:20S proteasome subunit beta 7